MVLLVYVGLLQWTYRERISPLFYYLGVTYRPPNPTYYTIAVSAAFGVGLLLRPRLTRPSDFVLWLLYGMMAVPAITVPQYANITAPATALITALVSAASFALVVLTLRVMPLFEPRFELPVPLVWLGILAVSVLCYAYMFVTTGLRFEFRSLGNVRDIRLAYRDGIAANGALLGYLVRLQGNVLNPLIIARGIYGRRPGYVIGGVVGQLLIFSATGYKMTFLSALALLAVAAMFRLQRRPRGSTIVVGLAAVTIASLAADALLGGFLYSEVFVDRLLLAPGYLVSEHVAVFEHLTKAKWGYSFLAPFVDYSYDLTPDFMVGLHFTGSSRQDANANLFADGYVNLGYLGIAVEAVILAGILWMVDCASRRQPLPVVAMVLLVPTIATANSSPFTAILSNGFLLSIVLLWIMPRDAVARSDAPPVRSVRLVRRLPARRNRAGRPAIDVAG